MQVDPFGSVDESLQGGVIAIGNFEGIHRGHCWLLAQLRQRARSIGGPAVAISFDPHPTRLLRPERAPQSLVWTERKEEILLASGADGVAILTTTQPFLNLSAQEFFDQIVLERFQARGMVEGRNFCYGRNRGGDVQVLADQCDRARLSLDVVDIITGAGDDEVSSSRIRRALIEDGDVMLAARLLGRPHRIRGRVVAGDRRGASIGFPTANLAEIPVVVPREGVYASKTVIDGKEYPAACNVGPNPTFGVEEQKFEAHLVGFAGDLYGRLIEIDLLARVRDVRKFAGFDEIRSQLALDVKECQQIAADYRHPYGNDLGQTITQWLWHEVGPAVQPIGVEWRRAVLDDSGRLTIHARVQGPLDRSATMDLSLRLEDRLRAVFPEVTQIAWQTTPAASQPG